MIKKSIPMENWVKIPINIEENGILLYNIYKQIGDKKGMREMSLVTASQMLADAQKGGYAVGAFNVENLEMIKAVLRGAREMEADVILQTTPSTIKYGDLSSFTAMAAAEAKRLKVRAALHLDHGDSFSLAAQALRQGYTSLMIDGSGLGFEENVELTRRVVEMASPNQIPVEAELGMVGGKEDDRESGGDGLTNPEEAREFVKRTGVSSLAVAIGTAHGFYKSTPKLDLRRLEDIRKEVEAPLVLHGASGIRDEDIKACIRRGICKVNFATELRAAYTDGVKELLRDKPSVYDPKKYGEAGMRRVQEVVMHKIQICRQSQ